MPLHLIYILLYIQIYVLMIFKFHWLYFVFITTIQCRLEIFFVVLASFNVSINGLLFTSKILSTYIVCCVCNVPCLCPMSLTCNSMNRRRKEKDSFMRFVIVSILHFIWLSPLPTARPLHFCFFGTGKYYPCLPSLLLFNSISLHKATWACGELTKFSTFHGNEGRSNGWPSPSTTIF